MKLPYPVTPARRDVPPAIRIEHITAAILILPAIAAVAYIIARIIFSLPTP